ncbi:hypothetical protein [Streptomyces sp. NBC_01538]|uniref:hypothetical protein n=1 Tax=Streptomyces sp. NBC_01538 TaxID=2903897 RepID=UPI00386FD598
MVGRSGNPQECGGRADRASTELVADAVADLFGDPPVLAGAVEADLLSNLVGPDQVLTTGWTT